MTNLGMADAMVYLIQNHIKNKSTKIKGLAENHACTHTVLNFVNQLILLGFLFV
jgi:hypothetical protein